MEWRNGTGLSLGLALGAVTGVAVGMVNDNIGLWFSMGVALGMVFGLAYDEQQKKKFASSATKEVDGVTYTLLRRIDPPTGLRHHCWVSESGIELEITDQEAKNYVLD